MLYICQIEMMVEMGYSADQITESLQLHRYDSIFATYHLSGIKSYVSNFAVNVSLHFFLTEIFFWKLFSCLLYSERKALSEIPLAMVLGEFTLYCEHFAESSTACETMKKSVLKAREELHDKGIYKNYLQQLFWI